jgi:ABC-2 type transport system ATP-binding protein
MKRLGILALLAFAAACRSDQTGPVPAAEKFYAVTAANDDGPPTSFPFGRDTYRIGVYTGAGRHKLDCTTGTDGARDCDGFLRSSVDKTLLDVKLEIPPGAGPFPLVALIHGYAGSKNSSGDIAARLLGDGYAILRYSTRGFGKSWGQVNLADLNAEIGDLHSMIGEVVDEPSFNLNPDAVAVTGASYGGGHSWLALVQPTFVTHKKNTVRIRAVVPIAPWTDLLYSLLPNGRPNHSIDGIGGLKFTYVNGLYGSGIRKDPERPYPNYPEYFMAWHAAMNLTEPSMSIPPWSQIVDGVAGYRSIWWQQAFWDKVAQNRVPVFQVQGLTDDLFPLPEAKRMLLALKTVVPDYPITSYFGDLGHPRATNQAAEVNYVLSLIEPWLAHYLKGPATDPAPTPYIYISRTDEPFNESASHIRRLNDWSELSSGGFLTHEWTNDPTTTPALVNPVTFVESGVVWDPFVMTAEAMLPNTAPFPSPATVLTSLNTVSIGAAQMSGSGSFMIAGQPTVTLDAVVKIGHRVQIDVRLIDVGRDGDRLITRGTITLEGLTDLGPQTIEIPTYGNRWMVESDHTLRLEISNVDSPYITPSREPSATLINKITLRIPIE